MPENPLEQASFDHVDSAGNLVFAVGDARFSVAVDDTLERAILEAKQIRSEAQPVQPQATATLPISQIQSLIRAGADPAKVAERYHLSEALVRRFSAAVETEKQYAIEQFLAVPAPKSSRLHSLADLIEHTLATARIGMESITWQATRRGLEPWRIVARFMSANRELTAEWTWNMHDNAVTCVNATAKQLLGERPEPRRTEPRGEAAVPSDGTRAANLPGDSIRSARIERTVSQWSMAHQPSVSPFAHPSDDASKATAQSTAAASGDASHADAASQSQADASAVRHTNEDGDETTVESAAASDDQAEISSDEQSRPQTPSDVPPAFAKPEKRKSGRSPMPSWDEILFGD
ncbi:septation protein SepH [Bifidobacterium sp. SO1]|uniref:septation protein SepH n=1 Tax=Bifidobacterium sp. SO1 TaxID=2809029 RepID=UPI001BDC6933|nr:septation protein SepH [Bifidobacterium sp. SO1]MBT1162337.1 DUF3071 domain-containing protein [Bifidobacterium sp. SO1]